MLISYAWLRELSGVDADAREAARRLTARGLTVDAVTEIDGDVVLDVDVPANRPDALGHRGVARELAAAFGTAARATSSRAPTGAIPGLRVAIDAPDLCGRYTAGVVSGVRVAPSPAWVVRRLEACGLRPINNVVDASNLVMLELGQPVHFFDRARLEGGEIRIRRARAEETLLTLDGVLRTLDAEMVVIADGARAVALGGVIGGAATEIGPETKDVLVEAAWFLPASVRRTGRALGISTDAGQRFERGCDPEAPPAAQALAARLLEELADGVPAGAIVDVYPEPFARRTLSVRTARASRLLGYAPAEADAKGALAAVGLDPEPVPGGFRVTVPSWRVDLLREEDLVEEIGRHLGYDRIPARVPATAPPAGATVAATLEERVRDRFASLGFCEAFNYAMVGPADDAAFVSDSAPSPMPLTNPIAEPLGWLRRAVIPGLARAAAQNVRRGVEDVRLFEVGRVFLPREPGTLPEEPLRAAFAWYGSARPRHWKDEFRAVDALDATGLVDDLLALAAGERPLDRREAGLPGLHPGQSTAWVDDDGRTLAWCGPIHPDLAARLDVPGSLLVGEIDLDAAARIPAPPAAYRPIPRVPGISRDLSIVLAPSAAAGAVIAALRAVPSPEPAAFEWIDRYEGAPLALGEAAMTLRVILRPQERTLTDAEAEAYRALLVRALDTVPGARLRRIDT